MDDAVILVGGRGKRLGKLTNKIPKPLIKIGDKFFLDILIKKILIYNFKHIYFLCSYKKEKFFKKYHNKKIENTKLICIDEGNQKDTGGGLIKLKNKIKNNFYLLNGDTIFNINIIKLANFKNKNTICKIALTKNNNYKNNKKINNIRLKKSNLICFSKNKTNLMNGGIYYFNKKIFKYLSFKKISLENDIIHKLILEKKVEGFYSNKKFIDIGTPKKINFLLKNKNYLYK